MVPDTNGPATDGTRRRQFVKALGAGGAFLLAGCSGGNTANAGKNSKGNGSKTNKQGGSGGSATNLKFVHTSSFTPSAEDLVPKFNGSQSDVQVKATATPAESSSTHKYFLNQFISQSSDFDLGEMDVIWPAEFATHKWISPVKDSNGYTDKMLKTPVDAATIDGTLYGMPLFTDCNCLYYRKDILDKHDYKPPKTYQDLVDQTQDILKKEDSINNGYIWQGGTNEGGTIMWLNWLWGMGGTVNQGGKLKVNTDLGVKALQHEVDLVHKYKVSPQSVASGKTDENRQTFQQGHTLFMRNWTYAYDRMNEDGSPVKDKFGVAPMPKAKGHSDAKNSCLGGWNIFINKYSKNGDAAQKFANYMATKKAQAELATNFSLLPVRKDIYSKEYYDKAPQIKTFKEIAQQTSARPATSKYPTFSKIVYTEVNKALVKSKSPQKALDSAQKKIDKQVNNA